MEASLYFPLKTHLAAYIHQVLRHLTPSKYPNIPVFEYTSRVHLELVRDFVRIRTKKPFKESCFLITRPMTSHAIYYLFFCLDSLRIFLLYWFAFTALGRQSTIHIWHVNYLYIISLLSSIFLVQVIGLSYFFSWRWNYIHIQVNCAFCGWWHIADRPRDMLGCHSHIRKWITVIE